MSQISHGDSSNIFSSTRLLMFPGPPDLCIVGDPFASILSPTRTVRIMHITTMLVILLDYTVQYCKYFGTAKALTRLKGNVTTCRVMLLQVGHTFFTPDAAALLVGCKSVESAPLLHFIFSRHHRRECTMEFLLRPVSLIRGIYRATFFPPIQNLHSTKNLSSNLSIYLNLSENSVNNLKRNSLQRNHAVV